MILDKREAEGLSCTINTTEDCNLRCKYCYEINKQPKSIDLETCYKFIDLLFSETDILQIEGKEDLQDGLIIDFIGGDSLINPQLLDDILGYVNYKYIIGNKFKRKGWRASISSNGTLFERADVRAFCEKWHPYLSLGVSIDGCPEIHDMNRVYPDGTGSMSTILKWWPWYKKWFPENALSTKATCAKSSIPYLYDSLKWMHETLGLKYINQNFIMEATGCTDEDYKELDRQLEKCCYYVLEHSSEMYWSMIAPSHFTLQKPSENPDFFTKGRCGSGCMPCLSIDGRIYPCFRWLPHTQQSAGVMSVGDVEKGFYNRQNFATVTNGAIRVNCTRDSKCLDCEYEPGCSYCIGGCYAEHGDFIRTTHICEITKLQYKWALIYKELFEKQQKEKYGKS